MATVPSQPKPKKLPDLADYPTGDGKPVGETPLHRDNLLYVVWMLRRHFAEEESIYVSGNMFLYYEEGDMRKHVSPDVQVTRGIPNDSNYRRQAYFTWVEGKGPDVVIEMTSPTTKSEDLKKKFALYRDVLKVREYFLFDPCAEYLRPQLQGHRLVDGEYVPIEPIVGDRLVSEVLNLHLQCLGPNTLLRIYDPISGSWLMDPDDLNRSVRFQRGLIQHMEIETQFLEAEREREKAKLARVEAALEQEKAALEKERAERLRLHAELKALRSQRKSEGQ